MPNFWLHIVKAAARCNRCRLLQNVYEPTFAKVGVLVACSSFLNTEGYLYWERDMDSL